MKLSVLIPTRGRPAKLARCVSDLAGQDLSASDFEVVVGLDGRDDRAGEAATDAWHEAGGDRRRLRIITCPRAGYIDVRHHLLSELHGEFVVSLNDDVRPSPGLLAEHLRAQQAALAAGRPAVIVGHSPFVEHPNPTLLDHLVARTSMVFFYSTMDGADPNRDWGFRHCFGLNFSAPLDLVRRVGGFPSMPDTYGYDDIELAYRLATRFEMPVLYRPEALAEHDHRYEPIDLLRREFNLGIAAWRYAALNPAFALAVFGRDITHADEIAYCRRFVDRERETAVRLERSFLRLGDLPASCLAGAYVNDLIELVYQQHLLLKRYVWRQGLLHEAGGGVPG